MNLLRNFIGILGAIIIIGGFGWLVWRTFKGKETQVSGLEDKERRISSLWYLLPLLAGFIGGLIGWLLTYGHNPKEARNLLVGGIIMTIFVILFRIFIASL
jgi:hypothetical protein